MEFELISLCPKVLGRDMSATGHVFSVSRIQLVGLIRWRRFGLIESIEILSALVEGEEGYLALLTGKVAY